MYGVGVWKHIRCEWGVFTQHTCLVTGNDARIKFLINQWCGSNSSRDSFPVLFRIARDKEISMVDNIVFFGD